MVALARSGRYGMEPRLASRGRGFARSMVEYGSFLVFDIEAFGHFCFHGNAMVLAVDLEVCHCEGHFATRCSLRYDGVSSFLSVAAFVDATTNRDGTSWHCFYRSIVLFAPLPQTADLFQANVSVGSSERTRIATVLRPVQKAYIKGTLFVTEYERIDSSAETCLGVLATAKGNYC